MMTDQTDTQAAGAQERPLNLRPGGDRVPVRPSLPPAVALRTSIIGAGGWGLDGERQRGAPASEVTGPGGPKFSCVAGGYGDGCGCGQRPAGDVSCH